MRIVLAKGRSQYGSLRLHLDQLAAALAGLGHEAVVVDMLDVEGTRPLVEALSAPTDAYFTFNGMGCEIAATDYMRQSACVFASLYVDHPVHHLPRLSHDIARQVVFFLDRSHVQFLAAWSGRRGFAHLGFLPPGANELEPPPDTSDAAFARRDIPLLFTGTYRGPPSPGWTELPEGAAKALLDETAERMAADGRLALLDAVGAAAAARKAPLTPELLRGLAPLLSAVQFYAEAFHRHVVLTALGEAGVAVEAHGKGWEALAARYPGFRHCGEGSFEETLGLLRRARLVLNINNGFVAGGHERVFTALAAGAGVFSESSRYYDESFTDEGPDREIATYPVHKPALIVPQLQALTADPQGLAAMARAGCAKARAEHTWTARAAKIIAAIEAAR
ncbi:MAG: glycosyltransferase family 1 protein [Caulobacteraceae bacterium]|nr:glycosyltransferase family 1 protein [Caulobacteraceae bacterium]